jgi:cyclic pyranopterin phosphate synthase
LARNHNILKRRFEMNTYALIDAIQQNLNENSLETINEHASKKLIDICALDSFFKKAGIIDLVQALKEKQFFRITAFPGCNLRCSYCNPEGLSSNDVLATEEILEIVKVAFELGIKIVHYTGGEPTERKDFVELVSATKKIGMTTIDVTTNGINLNRPSLSGGKEYDSMIEALYDSGLTGVSLSLDTFDPVIFNEMALSKTIGMDPTATLFEIKSAIEKTSHLIRKPGKFVINMVVTKLNFHEITVFLAYAKKFGGIFIPRFCELQNKGPAYGEHQEQFYADYITRKSIIEAVEDAGMGKLHPLNRISIDKQNAHAEYFTLGEGDLIIGIVAPYSQGWPCAKADCKRIRLGPTGAVNSCLENCNYQLKGKSPSEKKDLINQVIYQKLIRILTNDWPKTHGTDYLRLRFGLEKIKDNSDMPN